MSTSIHDFHDDARNAEIRIWVNGSLKPRGEATVSVFDSGFDRLVVGRFEVQERHGGDRSPVASVQAVRRAWRRCWAKGCSAWTDRDVAVARARPSMQQR